MSTAQQLGLIGNSVKVQSLPTASVETFGAGNRFYTLIGQQEGYITGHTYRTVVANDVYSWEDIDGGEETTYDYTVKVIDYDGTVLLEKKGNTGDVIDLPTAPMHDKLVFQEWSASVTVSDNKVTIADNDIMAGAIYTTASGQNEFDITLTKVTGLTVTLNMDGTKDWGDGTSDTATSHTYTAYGDYTIKCNGTTMTTSSSSGLFGQSSSSTNYYCTKARFSTVTSMSTYAFYNCLSLTNVIISNSVKSIGSCEFYNCYSLINIVIPNGVTSIGDSTFYTCYSLTNVVIPYGVTSIESNEFNTCYSLTNIVIPNSVNNIYSKAFQYCYSLTSIIIPNGVTTIPYGTFENCYSLTSVIIPNGVILIEDSSFRNCYSLTNIVIPNSVKNIYGSAFYFCYSLTNIVISKSIKSIGNYVFYNCYSLTKYDFSQCSSVPTLSNTSCFTSINPICKIIVPDSLYNTWKAASNWSTYADYIYKASEVTQ